MKKIMNTYTCVDLKTSTQEVMRVNKAVKGSLVMDEEHEHFTFEERPEPVSHPECRWHLMDRSKHGKVCMNGRHVKVEFYVKHEEYEDGRELADMLASEIETLGENLCDSPLPPATPYPFPKKGKGEITNDSNM